MLSTLLVVGVISHLWCAARLVGIAHHITYIHNGRLDKYPNGSEAVVISSISIDERNQGTLNSVYLAG